MRVRAASLFGYEARDHDATCPGWVGIQALRFPLGVARLVLWLWLRLHLRLTSRSGLRPPRPRWSCLTCTTGPASTSAPTAATARTAPAGVTLLSTESS